MVSELSNVLLKQLAKSLRKQKQAHLEQNTVVTWSINIKTYTRTALRGLYRAFIIFSHLIFPPSVGVIHSSCHPDEQTEAQQSQLTEITKLADGGQGSRSFSSHLNQCSFQAQIQSPGMEDGFLKEGITDRLRAMSLLHPTNSKASAVTGCEKTRELTLVLHWPTQAHTLEWARATAGLQGHSSVS